MLSSPPTWRCSLEEQRRCAGPSTRLPHRAKYCHEQAVRILLGSIDAAAGKYKRHIVPVMSVSVDFHIRCFVRVYTSAQQAKLAPTKVSTVYQCVGCDTFECQPVGKAVTKWQQHQVPGGFRPRGPEECPNCGWHYNMGGPFWTEPIHDMEWVDAIKKQVEENKAMYPGYDKIHALLTTVSEELPTSRCTTTFAACRLPSGNAAADGALSLSRSSTPGTACPRRTATRSR